MNTQYQNFGEFLQRKRTEKQITLRKMAEMIGITAPYLTDIEKDRRNPPEMEKLELISRILMLNDEDKTTMYDLAGKKRNSVAPDLPDYIMEHDYVSAALRTARDLDAFSYIFSPEGGQNYDRFDFQRHRYRVDYPVSQR